MRSVDLVPSMDPIDYYFSIHMDGSRPVVVMTRCEYWDAKGYLQDTSGPSGPDRVAREYGLYRLMDSTYEIPQKWRNDLAGLAAYLEHLGFWWNPEMSTKFGWTAAYRA